MEDKSNALIPMDEFNQLAPTNHLQLVAFIKQMIAAQAIPKHLKNVEQIISAWNYAAQLKLPPQPSLRNIAVIEGTPSLFGDLPLGLAQRHPDFDSYEEFCIDKDYNRICFENKNLNAEVWGGVVFFKRKGMEKPTSFAFNKEDAERAGLLRRAREGMPWKAYPQVMYIRRARIMGIRALFADALTGAGIAEDFGIAPDLDGRDVTPAQSMADEMNAEFMKDVAPAEEKKMDAGIKPENVSEDGRMVFVTEPTKIDPPVKKEIPNFAPKAKVVEPPTETLEDKMKRLKNQFPEQGYAPKPSVPQGGKPYADEPWPESP